MLYKHARGKLWYSNKLCRRKCKCEVICRVLLLYSVALSFRRQKMNDDFRKHLKTKVKTIPLFQSLSFPHLEIVFSSPFCRSATAYIYGSKTHVWPSGKELGQHSSSTTTYSNPVFFILHLTIKYFPMPESIYCQKAIFCFVLMVQINKRRRKGKWGLHKVLEVLKPAKKWYAVF